MALALVAPTLAPALMLGALGAMCLRSVLLGGLSAVVWRMYPTAV